MKKTQLGLAALAAIVAGASAFTTAPKAAEAKFANYAFFNEENTTGSAISLTYNGLAVTPGICGTAPAVICYQIFDLPSTPVVGSYRTSTSGVVFGSYIAP